MTQNVADQTLRESLMAKLPRRQDIAAAQVINVTIDVPAAVAAEAARLQAACNGANLTLIIGRYPVRETPALGRIATCLGFQGQKQYEGAVLKLLLDDPDAVAFVQSLFGNLAADIAAA